MYIPKGTELTAAIAVIAAMAIIWGSLILMLAAAFFVMGRP
jgi:hypothetical protein